MKPAQSMKEYLNRDYVKRATKTTDELCDIIIAFFKETQPAGKREEIEA